MPSSLQYWNIVPSSNATSDPDITSGDTQAPATLDDNIRSVMAAAAKYSDDTDGKLTAGGTANALTVTTYQVLISAQLTSGLFLTVKAAAANTTTAVTFAPDGLTAAPIKRADGSALAVGSIQPGVFLNLVYNVGTSEWWAQNIPPAALGVTDGSNAAAGQVGEFVSATGNYAVVSSGIYGNICVLNLTAGDWDVWGSVQITFSAGTPSISQLGISTVSITLTPPYANQVQSYSGTIAGNTPMTRVSLSATTPVYLVQFASFGGTASANGQIFARRVR